MGNYSPAAPVPLDRQALARELSCPKCSYRFETYPHYGPGNVIIDNCTRCDLVWMDFGELRQIVDAPGRDRGNRERPRVDEEYVRTGPSMSKDAADDQAHARTTDPFSLLLAALFGD